MCNAIGRVLNMMLVHGIVGTLSISAVAVTASCSQEMPAVDHGRGEPSATGTVDIAFFGGAERVSGSMAVLSSAAGKWIVDCGAFYPEVGETPEGRKELANAQSSALPAGAASADGVLLTHAHLDHIGRLPLLCRQGYRGPIYATPATIALSKTMLTMQVRYDASRVRDWRWSRSRGDRDYVKVHWSPDCIWRNRISKRNMRSFSGTLGELEEYINKNQHLLLNDDVGVSTCKVCPQSEVNYMLGQMVPVAYGEPIHLAEGVRAIPIDAGHIPGSCSWFITVEEGVRAGDI